MQGFSNSGEKWEEVNYPQWRIGTFTGRIFLPGEGNLRVSDFDDLNLFQS